LSLPLSFFFNVFQFGLKKTILWDKDFIFYHHPSRFLIVFINYWTTTVLLLNSSYSFPKML
jgi:hypothetical protein